MFCSYKGCNNKSCPFSTKAFFGLPKDQRRSIWIKNSGNEELLNISPNTKKVFCENHFSERNLRKQFNRTLLRRDAVPEPYGEEVPAKDNLQNEEIEYLMDDDVAQEENNESLNNDKSIEVEEQNDSETSSEEVKQQQSLNVPKPPILSNAHKPEEQPTSTTTTTTTNNGYTLGYTEDEHFALSLVGPLQRLTNQRKAVVKLKILELLYQTIEHDEE